MTVDQSQWSWKPNATFYSSKEILIDLLRTIGGGGNYLINIGPRPDGTFEPEVVANMKELGKWVKAHSDAIYGTRGGDFTEKGKFTSTQKGNTTNLFVFDDSVNEITLKSDKRKLLSVKNEKGQTVAFQQTNEKITLKLDENNGGFLRIYKLTF